MFRGILIAPLLTALLSGCAGRSQLEDPPDGGDDLDAGLADVDAGPPPAPRSDKLDLLLVVDNSRGLDLAHALLADTLPYLMDRLVKPACVNGLGNVVDTTPSPTDPCPSGLRDFAPLTDIHVAVISTSLGGHGADICSPASVSFNPTQNDAGHLLNRAASGGVVPTYADKGFLAWDPGQKLSPPGDADVTALSAKLADLVRGAGTMGCGYESQLESIYRFLIDPNPYASIAIEGGIAVPTGTDQILLQQRGDFMRPDSALAIVLLTDENDCSTRDGSQYYLSNQGLAPGGPAFHLPRARSECAKDPNDACCASCAQSTPQGCPDNAQDPSCQLGPMTALEDPINLRCFDQKRRFGVDFLYPIDRYVKGLTEPYVADRDGTVVENPIFAGGRDPSLVFFEGIVGLPWQDIAVDPKVLGTGFLPAFQIDWSLFFGDPEVGDPPYDALMIESVEPRMGENPATGEPITPPSGGFLENAINGHERTLAQKDDLQIACLYRRPMPKDCSADMSDCECVGENIDTNPVCQNQDGSYSSVQRFARALPGTRVLSTLQGLVTQAVVGSVCAAVTTDHSQATFGYKPSVDALLRTMRRGLREAEPQKTTD